MGRTTLFAVSLAFLLVSVSSSAQQPLTPVSDHLNRGTGNSASSGQAQPAVGHPMTAREMLEMHGDILMARKEYPEALTSFEKALSLDPTVFDRKANGGTVVQQRSTPDPGLFYFFVAKSFAQKGDAEHTAHYLKLARDDGYAGLLTAQTDPGFAKVIKDPGVQEVLHVAPAYASNSKKTVQN